MHILCIYETNDETNLMCISLFNAELLTVYLRSFIISHSQISRMIYPAKPFRERVKILMS